MSKHIHCPANGWDCPYYKNGLCKMEEMDGVENVYYECDDFAYFYEEGEDYYCDCEEG